MLSQQARFWIRCGALSGGLAVILGAFAAHGLEGHLTTLYAGKTREVMGESIPAASKYLADFKTAAEYQMYHSLAMIVIGLIPMIAGRKAPRIAGWSFLLGTVLFSGSLYLLVLTGYTRLGMVTPIGGLLFIVGWVALACSPISPRGLAPIAHSGGMEGPDEDTYIVKK